MHRERTALRVAEVEVEISVITQGTEATVETDSHRAVAAE